MRTWGMERMPQEPSFLDAMNKIIAMRQDISMQPISDEPNVLEGISARLNAGELTPREAIEQVRKMREGMQDYK